MKRLNNIKEQLSINEYNKNTKIINNTLNKIAIISAVRTPFTNLQKGKFCNVPPDILLTDVITELLQQGKVVEYKNNKNTSNQTMCNIINDKLNIQEIYISNIDNPVSAFQLTYACLGLALGNKCLSVSVKTNSSLLAPNLQNINSCLFNLQIYSNRLCLVLGIDAYFNEYSYSDCIYNTITSRNYLNDKIYNYNYQKKFVLNTNIFSQNIFNNKLSVNNLTPYGVSAEYYNKKHNIKKKDIDKYAENSVNNAINNKDNRYVIPIKINKMHINNTNKVQKISEVISEDELNLKIKNKNINYSNSKKSYYITGGTYTTENIGHLSIGSGGLCLINYKYAVNNKLKIISSIVSVEYGFDLINPEYSQAISIKNVLKINNLNVEDIDFFELNETFSGLVIITANTLNIPLDKINITGGNIAYGDALSVIDIRMIISCINSLKKRGGKYGIVTSTITLKIGISVLIENE